MITMRVFSWKQTNSPICQLVNFVSVFVGIHECGTSFGLDEIYLEHPLFGSRTLAHVLNNEGQMINRKRVQRLMRLMEYNGL